MRSSCSSKIWTIKPPNDKPRKRLEEELKISPFLAQLLINRGIQEPELGYIFLDPKLKDIYSPFLLKDMDKAVERIIRSLYQNEPIFIYGDYDADGISSTALLLEFFTELGARSDFFIPLRDKHGYGLNREGIDKAIAAGARLLITVDCGSSNMEEIKYGNEKGLDTIITDHHSVPPELPPAHAIINPLQKDCAYPFKSLAGVGVAFNLVMALRSRLKEKGFFNGHNVPNLRGYLDLVALGTVADIVPLIDQNRIYVKHGLQEIKESKRPGIIALKEVSAYRDDGIISAQTIAFRFAPRLNATGRLGDAAKAVHLLTTRDQQTAQQLARKLDEKNRRRQSMEEKILKEAELMIEGSDHLRQSCTLVLASPDWHQGVVGIVASRLVDKYHKPTVLICIEGESGRGSARSIKQLDLFACLTQNAHYLKKFGGHKQAAGLHISVQNIDYFRQAFEEYVRQKVTPEAFIPALEVDDYLNVDAITYETIADLEMLAPHGFGNPEPLFIAEGLQVAKWQIVGDGHLKMKVSHKNNLWDAIGFGLGRLNAEQPDAVDLIFVPQINEWQGRKSIQLKVKDFRRGLDKKHI